MEKIEYAKKIFFTHLKQNKDMKNTSVLDSINCSSLITGISIYDIADSLNLNVNVLRRSIKDK